MIKGILSYYNDFSFKKINTPKYRHMFYILFWPLYIAAFVITEQITAANYTVVECSLDAYIPFCELFVVPYILWYPCLAFVGFYTLFLDIAAFKKFHKFLSITCAITFTIYVLFPSQQNLRPEGFAHNNIFTSLMDSIYSVDTNTNVCPSIHVIFSLGMLFSMWNSKHFSSTASRTVSLILTVLICASTVFLKQHSVIDLFAGTALSLAVFPLVFVKKLRKNKIIKKE